MSECSKKCRSCKYSSGGGYSYSCAYITKTGNSRGCPAGEECTRYVTKTKSGKDKLDDANSKMVVLQGEIEKNPVVYYDARKRRGGWEKRLRIE